MSELMVSTCDECQIIRQSSNKSERCKTCLEAAMSYAEFLAASSKITEVYVVTETINKNVIVTHAFSTPGLAKEYIESRDWRSSNEEITLLCIDK